MAAFRYSSDELMNRIETWARFIGNKKRDSFACNLPIRPFLCKAEEGCVIYAFETASTMENPWGVTHGGVLAMALDWAMGITARCALDVNDAPTVTMQVDYLKPVPLNTTLYIEVTVDHAGRNLSHLCAKGYLELGGDVHVSASGHYVMRAPPLLFEEHQS